MSPRDDLDGPIQHIFERKDSIGDRLFRRAFGVYLVFAALLTLILVAEVVFSARTQIREELAGHEKVFHRALAKTLWDMDLVQLDAIARGILDVPVIEQVRIIDPVAKRVFVDIRRDTSQVLPDVDYVIYSFPVLYGPAGQAGTVGVAEFRASRQEIFARVQRSVGLLLVLALVKIIAMYFIFRWFAGKLVRDPLRQLAAAALRSAPGASGTIDMEPDTRRAVEGTEIETLRDAYNALIGRVEMNRARFAQMAEQLEVEVERRTRELRSANERLGQLASTDDLTLLANRRGLESFGEIVIAQARRKGTTLALLAIDIDRFKSVNDAFGHEAGDRVLQAVAQCLRTEARQADVAARTGGDEFALLLPEATFAEAMEIGQRIRGAVEASPVPLDNGVQVRVTLSVGVAVSHGPEVPLVVLLAKADEALYEAKRLGRNQVRAANPGAAANSG